MQFLELHFLHRKIGQLRGENQNQNKDIAMLKKMVGFQNNKTFVDPIVSLMIKKKLNTKNFVKQSSPPSTNTVRYILLIVINDHIDSFRYKKT